MLIVFFFIYVLLQMRQIGKKIDTLACRINKVTTGVYVTLTPIPFHKNTS